MIRASVAVLSLLFLTGPAMAQSMGGTAPAILEPREGATVTSPVTIVIGAMGNGSGMANMQAPQNGAHPHLLIDAPLPTPGKMVPMDAHHIHLMHGETRKTVQLAAGTHTIQVVIGSASHVVAPDAPHSDPVTFQVK